MTLSELTIIELDLKSDTMSISLSMEFVLIKICNTNFKS